MTESIEHVYRAEFGRALATVARIVGDIALAEDAVQEAFADALRTWPVRGQPASPGAWITTAARNRALDRIRREAHRDAKEIGAAIVAPPVEEAEVWPVPDDQLRLIFTCCHPALSSESQVALTLRLVCGLRTAEIARAFMQPEATVAQRLRRAKTKIRLAGIPVRVPPVHLLPERTPQVLACIYLVFTEGYFATARAKSRARRVMCGSDPTRAVDVRTHARGVGELRTARADTPQRQSPCRAREPRRRAGSPRGAGPQSMESRDDFRGIGSRVVGPIGA